MFFILLGSMLTHPVIAQEANPHATITKTIALTNVNLMVKPGDLIELGDIIIEDGLISAIGKNLTIPAGTKVLEGDSLYAYPGFIGGFSHMGIPAPKSSNNRNGQSGNNRVKDPGNPPNDVAGITPDQTARDHIKMEDGSIGKMRALGITAAHVAPRKGMLPGKGVVTSVAGESVNDMIIADNTALAASLTGARRVFPATIIGVMSKFRELYLQSAQLADHMEKYEANPSGMKRPEMDEVLEAIVPTTKKEIPVYFKASDLKSIYRVLQLQKDLGFDLVLTEVKQGWPLIEQIKQKNIPVLLSMDLPEEKKSKKKKEEKAEEKTDEQKALEARKAASVKAYNAQAAEFSKAGIDFGFSFSEVTAKKVKGNLRTMIKHGLSEDAALKALTQTPAKMLGVDNIMGSLEKGKMGNLVVSNQPYFEEDSSVKYVIVEGQVFEYEVKPKKKEKGKEEAKSSDSDN